MGIMRAYVTAASALVGLMIILCVTGISAQPNFPRMKAVELKAYLNEHGHTDDFVDGLTKEELVRAAQKVYESTGATAPSTGPSPGEHAAPDADFQSNSVEDDEEDTEWKMKKAEKLNFKTMDERRLRQFLYRRGLPYRGLPLSRLIKHCEEHRYDDELTALELQDLPLFVESDAAEKKQPEATQATQATQGSGFDTVNEAQAANAKKTKEDQEAAEKDLLGNMGKDPSVIDRERRQSNEALSEAGLSDDDFEYEHIDLRRLQETEKERERRLQREAIRNRKSSKEEEDLSMFDDDEVEKLGRDHFMNHDDDDDYGDDYSDYGDDDDEDEEADDDSRTELRRMDIRRSLSSRKLLRNV